jgi:predicted RNase H-like nuclease
LSRRRLHRLDDVLDAGAAAWTANRIGLGCAATLPDPPEIVGGRRICIWY